MGKTGVYGGNFFRVRHLESRPTKTEAKSHFEVLAMNTLQSITAVIALIFALSVIVQAIQEFIKNFRNSKPKAMMQALDEFMGNYLNSADVKTALGVRGLDVTALEKFSTSDFRNLLDAIPFQQVKLQGIVQSATASVDQIKDNIAGAYQGALARFNQIYTKKNKQIAVLLSMVVVFALNANIIILYENISSDPAAQQAILEKVKTIDAGQEKADPSCKESEITCAYRKSRDDISEALQKEPVLFRTLKYESDYGGWPKCFLLFGLFIMGALVSLGAPFWNDVLKGANGVNNAFNGNAQQS